MNLQLDLSWQKENLSLPEGGGCLSQHSGQRVFLTLAMPLMQMVRYSPMLTHAVRNWASASTSMLMQVGALQE